MGIRKYINKKRNGKCTICGKNTIPDFHFCLLDICKDCCGKGLCPQHTTCVYYMDRV